ncbi:MAG: hypothetical protein IKA70_03145 [Alistipes sp.]|nr:hypothetical protein [Alistipes sp.]
MRKMFVNALAITALLFACAGLSSCVKDATEAVPSLEVGTPVVHSAAQVDVPLRVSALSEIAYQVLPASEEAPVNATVLFKNGTKVGGGTSILHLTGQDGLQKGVDFKVYVAASISATTYLNDGKIFEAAFTTPDAYAEDVTVLQVSSEGANVYVQFPQVVCDNCSRLKWGVGNVAMMAFNGNPPMPRALHTNDSTYPASLISADTMLTIDHYHAYARKADGSLLYTTWAGYDENGGSIWRESTPEEIENGEGSLTQYYEPAAPGEPLVLMLSEVSYADCINVFPTEDYGWGPGWYKYPYDMDAYMAALYGGGGWGPLQMPMPGGGGGSDVNADDYWEKNAWYKRVEFQTAPPQPFDGTVKVEITDVTCDNAVITLTPDSKTTAYVVGLFADVDEEYGGDYQGLLNQYLKGNENYVQWFSTSVLGGYMGFMQMAASEGPVQIPLNEYFYKLYAGMKYHVIVTAVDGTFNEWGELQADLSKQNFQHITFNLKNYSLPEPKVVVTGHEAYSPYYVKFNVKNPDYASNPLKKAIFACNYSREFKEYLSYDYTLTDILSMNSYDDRFFFSEDDLKKINSAEGLDVEFDSRENATTMLAVMGWNAEGRASNPDAEGSQALGEAKSTIVPATERVEFTKLANVAGTWTATAKVEKWGWSGVTDTLDMTSTVTIGDLVSPDALTEEDYALFEEYGVTKEQTDAYFAEFKKQEAAYNTSVRGQNRVLCQGWDFSATKSSYYNELELATPWDLFVMEDYNASLVDYLFYDFGPKWFLQEDAEGRVFLPVNMYRVQPLTAWMSGKNYYLCAADRHSTYAFAYPTTPDGYWDSTADITRWPNIPVEVSEDGNTITIKGVAVQVSDENGEVVQELKFYPNIIYESYGSLEFLSSNVISDVVLTRSNGEQLKTSATKLSAMRKHAVAAQQMVKAKSINGKEIEANPIKHGSRTTLVMKKKPAVKKLDVKQMTGAQIEAKRAEYIKANMAKKGVRK